MYNNGLCSNEAPCVPGKPCSTVQGTHTLSTENCQLLDHIATAAGDNSNTNKAVNTNAFVLYKVGIKMERDRYSNKVGGVQWRLTSEVTWF